MQQTSSYQHGWYKLAFVQDLKEALTPVTIGERRLVIVHTKDAIRVVDADCPHRGAHLGYGGTLVGDCIVCPFHRYKIGIGQAKAGDFQVREYETFVIGGSVYVRLSDQHDNGFREHMQRLAEEYTIHPGFTMDLRCPAEIIIENGFDNTHFRPVHGVDAARFQPVPDASGNLSVTSCFYYHIESGASGLPSGTKVEIALQLNAFSPYLSTAQLGGRMSLTYITSVNPINERLTRLRFSLALSKKVYGNPPSPHVVQSMLQGNRSGIQDDAAIWENMSFTSPRKHTSQDVAVLAFEEFCTHFR